VKSLSPFSRGNFELPTLVVLVASANMNWVSRFKILNSQAKSLFRAIVKDDGT
jgi:hypothetical protein